MGMHWLKCAPEFGGGRSVRQSRTHGHLTAVASRFGFPLVLSSVEPGALSVAPGDSGLTSFLITSPAARWLSLPSTGFSKKSLNGLSVACSGSP